MQTEPRLIDLVDDLCRLPSETGWVEFKMNNTDPDRIGRTVSALSNSARLADKPFGYMVWGVEDGAQRVKGTKFEPGREKQGNQPLEFWLAGALSPRLAVQFISIDHPEGRVVLLEIPAAHSVPVKYRDIAYVRIGEATPKLSEYPDREADLLNKLRPFAWEQGVAASYVSGEDVLDWLDFSEYFQLTNQRLPETRAHILERMAEDRLIAQDVGGKWNILNLGAILFAKRLDKFERLTRKAVRVIQYEGTNKNKTKKRQEGERGYAVGFEGLINYLDDLLPSSEEIGKAFRTEKRTFPEIAIRELVANALIHQDMTVTGAGPIIEVYDDRVEISNPGAPVTDMLNKLFGAPPRSRNEMLARLMRRMAICEEQGSGLVKVITAAEEFRLPAPEFRAVDGSMTVVLSGPMPFSDLDKGERVRLCYQHAALMHHNRKLMTNASLRERFGIEHRNAAQVSRVIKEALAQGLIRIADPERPKAGYVPYWA